MPHPAFFTFKWHQKFKIQVEESEIKEIRKYKNKEVEWEKIRKWYNWSVRTHILLIGKRKENQEKGGEKIIKEIIQKKFPQNWAKRKGSAMCPEQTPIFIIIKFQNIQDKGKIQKTSERKKKTYKDLGKAL